MKVKVAVDRVTLKAFKILSDKPLEKVLKEHVYNLFSLLEGRLQAFNPAIEEVVYCPFCLQKVSEPYYIYHFLLGFCRGLNISKVEKFIGDRVRRNCWWNDEVVWEVLLTDFNPIR